MAAHGAATHLTAGPMAISAPLPGDALREYEKILTISDEIFSGSHPRLKVPQHLVRKPASRNGQNAPVRPQLPKPAPPRSIVEKVPPLETNQPYNSSHTTPAALSAAPPSARLASKPTSEIDPIFLTKSDDLVRAELQLQRQRVERQLRDQVELRRMETKQKTAVQDTKPEFDVSEVFKQALEVVKPVSLCDSSEASGPDGQASDFDNNSYYSSRAPDSPLQAGGQQKSSPVAIVPPAGPAQHGPVAHYPDELQRLEALNQPGSDQEMQDAYHVADQRPMYTQTQSRHQKAEDPNPYRESPQIEAADDSEYSPPAPAAPLSEAHDYPREIESGRQLKPDVRYIELPRGPRKPPSPANVRVVQNHITSPAAPRPSRVSPLATAKVPPVQHLRDERIEHASEQVYSDPDSARGSPANAPTPVIMSRKRRRLREGGAEPRHASQRTRNAEPVETYIKEEPVSPPPFADDLTTSRNRHAQDRPIYIDVASPQYAPVYENRGPPIREPVYEIDPYHEFPSDSGPPRTISRLSTRRPIREDADLRRVASLQYARQSDYPREYMEAPPRPMRATSYVVERPVQERPRYYEETPSYPQHRYIHVDDMPPPTYREPYYEEAPPPPPPRIMAPQRRIVYDEHGNQYYEVLPAPRYQPMAPPPRPISQMSKTNVYDDQTPHHNASVRAPSVVQDPYVERRYVQEMPPPQPIYRRVATDYGRPVSRAHERQPYATPLEGHEPYSRSGSVQVEYIPPRHPAYLDERGIPQERVIRTTSVYPPQPRYEEPHEVVQRVGSMRPSLPGREVSVLMEDRPVGEYVERPYYIRDRRYYDAEGEEGDRIALDGANDTVQRVRHYQ
ncbi:uncharacterized protein N7511_001627 [Penicillium nucicola]|uniref:uncharacterized protein n=1 Tax=Penicillium nucicola TaxID=1850975 RepID=UPI00254505BE|nr:uncharacterized protein N7511_001627 [Penicillium nucicola]KAJ5776616.1 hypothetical protein N7511_001627 [Penicillium nucicola]